MALPITSGDGSITSQKNTQTPQASVGPANKATSGGNVQPGTANSLLTTQTGGISLTNQTLPTVTVGGASTGTIQEAQAIPEPAKHHLNPVAAGFVILLFVLAIACYWLIARSAKNTTY